MIQVLLVEDDASIVKVIKDYFERREDFAVDVAENGLIGEDLFYERSYDLVLLDVMMPKKNGFELCKDIRRSNVPIIFITAREKTEDALCGYNLSCDDYIVKPFSLETLYAKCLALVKRDKGFVDGTFVKAGPIKMNPISSEELFSGQYNTETRVTGRMLMKYTAFFCYKTTIYSGQCSASAVLTY